jgi:hypothetical protein
MLFDLEDYRVWGIIGPDNKPANQINWVEPYTTSRATRDAYHKAVNEYFLASQVMCTPEEAQIMNVKYVAFLESNLALGLLSKEFWQAMVSLPITSQLTVGDRFDIMTVGKYDQNSSYMDYPAANPNDTWWANNYKNVAVSNPSGEFTYTEMSQQLYDDYKTAFVGLQSIVKDIIMTSEGVETFNDYVAPAIPAWDSYPELSGYVRGTNNVTIKNAVVRLVDGDGVNHDIITDDNGYYKFDKEMFFTNIAFNHDAPSSTFNMFLLENLVGSTASLYDSTSKFENSFFGAENNRDITWAVEVKMGKQSRRNFKIEFLPDYSNYPSFSGYVKDANGNPIVNALVLIKDGDSGWGIGQYRKVDGNFAMNFTYNDFGIARTILTDENGFYEYTSQMVGEWFNKELMSINGQSHLNGRTFDQYFVNPQFSYSDNFTGRSLNTNETFMAMLIPYVQNVNNNSISWEGVSIYDNNDYYSSRFKYALNPNGEFFYQKIELNKHYDINVDVVTAIGDEVRADKVSVECSRKMLLVDNSISNIYMQTSTSYAKIVFSNGSSQVFNSDGWFNSSNWFSINSSNVDNFKNFYIYACDSNGRAVGYIKTFNSESRVVKNVDLSELTYINGLRLTNLRGNSIDVSGLEYLRSLDIQNAYYETITGLSDLKRLDTFNLYNTPIESLDLSTMSELSSIYFGGLPITSLDISSNSKLTFVDFFNINLTTPLDSSNNNLRTINFNQSETLLSDDVDNLLIELASKSEYYGNINISGVARTSDSDDAYDTLAYQRGWNINLGDTLYETIVTPKKLVLTIDPTKIDNGEWANISGNISTTTGYWKAKSWNGQLRGNYYNSWNQLGMETHLDDTRDLNIEIYSVDYWGRPSGEMTGFEIDGHNLIKNVNTSQLTNIDNIYISNLDATSLDFRANRQLTSVRVTDSNSLLSLDLTGMTSLISLTLTDNYTFNNLIGFSGLTSLANLDIQNMSSLPYVSLEGLSNIKNVYINSNDLYDSTHVDTMLSELNIDSATKLTYFDTQISTKTTERDAKQVELDVISSDLTILNDSLSTLNSDLNQLISDGADQSLIDSKQAEVNAKQDEVNAKQAELDFVYTQYQVISNSIDSLIQDRNSYSSGLYFNTNYMARTSASDNDYNELINKGWNLQLGSEFVAPYTAPVKGYLTTDFLGLENSNGDNLYFYFTTDSGYIKLKDANGNTSTQNSNQWFSWWVPNGIIEFWSVDNHERPSGKIINLYLNNNNANWAITNVDLSNLTELINLEIGLQNITSLDLTGLDKIVYLNLHGNSKLENLVLPTGVTDLNFNNNPKITTLDTSSMTDLEIVYLEANSGLTSLDFLSNKKLNSLQIYDQDLGLTASIDVTGLLNLNNVNYASLRTLTTADLDVLLGQLDQNVIAQVATQSAILADLTTQRAAKQAELDLIDSDLSTLNGDLSQLISDGADQSLIDVKQAEVDAKQAERNSKLAEVDAFDNQINSVNNVIYNANHGYLNTNWVARSSASDVAFNNLTSYGWNLQLGSEFVGPNEAPVKGRVYYSADKDGGSYWVGLQIQTISGYYRFRDPNGNVYNRSGMVSWSFDSNMPEADRYFEFWGCDQHGRPTNNITDVYDQWNGPIKSVDFTGLTKLRYFASNNNSYLTSLDFTGLTGLNNLDLNNNTNLESIIIDGCSNIRYINLNGSNKINVDQLLLAIDSTGSVGNPQDWGDNYLNADLSTRTNATDTIVDSLYSKDWGINVKEPVGTPVVLHVNQGEYFNFYISTSGGAFKVLYPVGTQEHNDYPDGQFYNWCKFSAPDDWSQTQLSMSPSFTGNITIISCDHDGNVSGEIRGINSVDCNQNFTFDFSTLSKLKFLSMNYIKSSIISQLSSLNLSRLQLNYCDSNITTLDLSNISTVQISIQYMDSVQNVILKSDLKKLYMYQMNSLVSVDLPNGLKVLGINFCNSIQTLSLPSNLQRLSLGDNGVLSDIGDLPTTLTGLYLSGLSIQSQSLDLSNCVDLFELSLSYVGSTLTSLDITGLQKLDGFQINGTYIDTIVGFENTKVRWFYNYNSPVTTMNFVLPVTIETCYISNANNMTTVDISILGDVYRENGQFYLDGCGAVTSILSLPSVRVIYLNYMNSDFSLPVVDSRTFLQIYGGQFTSVDLGVGNSFDTLRFYNCYNLTSIDNLPNTINNLSFNNCYNLTIDLSNTRVNNELFLHSMNNFVSVVNASSVYIQYSMNINLSGSKINNQLYIYNCYGDLNFSNINLNIYYKNTNFYFRECRDINSIIIDNTRGAYLYADYNYSNHNWSFSLLNCTFDGFVEINRGYNLTTIDATGISAKYFVCGSNGQLTDIKLSIKDIIQISTTNNSQLNNVELYDASSNNNLQQVLLYNNYSFSANTVDNILNSISQTNRTGVYMYMTHMNYRTSSSQTAFNKIANQGWNLQNQG